jgi:hypothetical protein
MRQKYTVDANGFLDYADDALHALRGAKDRAIHLNDSQMVKLVSEALDKTIAASGRGWAVKHEGK